MCGCLSYAPYWGPGLQPRQVPWLGNRTMTPWITGWHSIHWVTQAREEIVCFLNFHKGTALENIKCVLWLTAIYSDVLWQLLLKSRNPPVLKITYLDLAKVFKCILKILNISSICLIEGSLILSVGW